MEIHIITKNVYGNDLFYVKDPNQASVLRRLTGRKTVSRLDIDMLVRLDVKVTVSEEAQEALGWNVEETWAKGESLKANRLRDSKRLNGPKDRFSDFMIEEEWWSGDPAVLDLDELHS